MARGGRWAFFFSMSLALPLPAFAAELGNEGDLLSLEVHGFGSPGFMVSTQNNYLTKSSQGSFDFVEVGINFTKPLTDKLRFGVQLYAADLGGVGKFTVKADWFYLDYRFRDWFGLRAGRVKLPYGLYNETNDIDSARVPILLPQSVYPIADRNYLLAQTGAEVYGYADMGRGGALDYRLYGGTIFIDNTPTPGSPVQITDLSTRYIVGGRLLWETPLKGLRAALSIQALELDTTILFSLATPVTIGVKIPVVLGVASLEYAFRDLLLTAEYSRWDVSSRSTNTVLFPNESNEMSERAYAMASYRVASWFQPGAYYSLYYPDVSKRVGRANQQHDIAATLRFDINSFWLVKLEGHYMNGTADLTSSLNGNQPINTLPGNWALFLIKTTVYF
jgi:hypothetical protein